MRPLEQYSRGTKTLTLKEASDLEWIGAGIGNGD